MALVRTNRIGSQSATGLGAGSFTTASFTPSNSSLLVAVCVGVSGGLITASSMTISDSLGSLTWTSQLTVDDTWAGNQGSARVWTTPIATGASMTVTVDAGTDTVDQFTVFLFDYTGYNSTPLGATASNTNAGTDGALTITLSSAPASDSEVVGVLGRDDNTGISSTEGAGWTEQWDLDTAGHCGAQLETRTGSTSTSVTWADLDTAGSTNLGHSIAFAFEIRAAAGGPAPEASFDFTPTRFDDVLPGPSEVQGMVLPTWFDPPAVLAAGVDNPLAISVTSTQTPTITKGVGLPRALTSTQTPSIAKAMAKTLAVTSSQVASVAKNVAKAAVTLTETQTVSRAVATTFSRTFSVVSTQTASILKNVGLPRSLTETQTASLAKTAGKNVALTETQTASITKNVGITRSVTETQTVTAIIGRAFVKVISVTSTQAASIAKAVGLNRALTSTQAPSIVKGVGKNVAVTETQVPTVTKNVALTRSVTQTQTVVATIGRAFVKVITVTQTQTASIVKSVGKRVSVTSTQTPSVAKAIAKTILATVTQTVARIIDVVTAGPASTVTQVQLSYVEQSSLELSAAEVDTGTVALTVDETSLSLSAAPVNTGAVTLVVVESSLELSVEEQ